MENTTELAKDPASVPTLIPPNNNVTQLAPLQNPTPDPTST